MLKIVLSILSFSLFISGCNLQPIYKQNVRRGGKFIVDTHENQVSPFIVQRMRVILGDLAHLIPEGVIAKVNLAERSGNITIGQGAETLRTMTRLYATIDIINGDKTSTLNVDESTSYSHIESDPFINTQEDRAASERLMILLSNSIITRINTETK